jgi:hypothetical protein
LHALYERGDPGYFIHPALYYEILAAVFAVHRSVLQHQGALEPARTYLMQFVSNQTPILELARAVSFAFGCASAVAASLLGFELAGAPAALAAGVGVGCLPLLRFAAGSIRVDALYLFVFLLAVQLILRYHRRPGRRSLALAAAGIGAAAAANYPGALLLLPLLAGKKRAREDALSAVAISFAAFSALNPYAWLHFGEFIRWFAFQAWTVVSLHPFAGDWQAGFYAKVLWQQGILLAFAATAGAAACASSRDSIRRVAVFACFYAVLFSLFQSQYERFILPAAALLVVAGASYGVDLAARRPLAVRAGAAAGALLIALSAAGAGPIEDGGPDPRAEMLSRLLRDLPDDATVIYESDAVPLLQTAMEPGFEGSRFRSELHDAFVRFVPAGNRRWLKAQFIGGVANYEPDLLDSPQAYFLGSSKNSAFLRSHRSRFPEPNRFLDALEGRCRPLEAVSGGGEELVLCSVLPARRG